MSRTAEELSANADNADEVAIRARFEDAIRMDGRPLAQIAPETGIAYGTLAAWRSAKYAGNNMRIAETVRQWLVTREAKHRTRSALPAVPDFVMTPTASRIIEVLERALVLPDIAVIAGGAGIGKTSAIRKYQAMTPNVFIATMQACTGAMRAMMEVIGAELGTFRLHRTVEMSDQIVRKLRNTNGLLIIDEAQHLDAEAMDQLRSFHDAAQIGIALVGNETVFGRFGAERRTPQFAQLFSRVGQRFTRRELTKGDLDALIGAWDLADEEATKAVRTIARLPGAARGMTKCLRMAFVLARSLNRSQPNKQDIEAAWSQLSGEAL